MGSFLTGANEFGDTPSNIAIWAPSAASMATKLSAIMDHASPQHLVFRGADCFLMAAMRSAFFLGSGNVMVTPASGRDWAPCVGRPAFQQIPHQGLTTAVNHWRTWRRGGIRTLFVAITRSAGPSDVRFRLRFPAAALVRRMARAQGEPHTPALPIGQIIGEPQLGIRHVPAAGLLRFAIWKCKQQNPLRRKAWCDRRS